MRAKRVAKRLLPPIVAEAIRSLQRAIAYRRYVTAGGVPFTLGYSVYQKQFIADTLKNPALLAAFLGDTTLPTGYGVGIDERCVEYPWMIAQLNPGPGRLLDAGSTLNHSFMLDLPLLQGKEVHILTLAPEAECFWDRGVSYLFHDLRCLPIRDDYYDSVVCLSTLEHVGCDNSNYTGQATDRENRPSDYVVALEELSRVLRPGGSLLLTVPFGIYAHLGFQQQFNSSMLEMARATLAKYGDLITRFYRYSADGWNVATEADCVTCRYVDWTARVWAYGEVPKRVPREPDNAVAARAVVCLRLNKSTVEPCERA